MPRTSSSIPDGRTGDKSDDQEDAAVVQSSLLIGDQKAGNDGSKLKDAGEDAEDPEIRRQSSRVCLIDVRNEELVLGGSVGSREHLRGICSTLSTFGGGERDSFEGTLPSQAANLDEVAQFLMYLSDVSSEQGLNAVEAVIHDGLVVSDVVQCVSVLDQDVIETLIEVLELVKERGRRRGGVRRDARFTSEEKIKKLEGFTGDKSSRSRLGKNESEWNQANGITSVGEGVGRGEGGRDGGVAVEEKEAAGEGPEPGGVVVESEMA
ncbi:hypothetical protein Cgig2_014204 [Carnegiea gigantea]|uniref:Uncharacterized protein n=1 Tax=Carnegiea gigantea TaxID=171969 RepID=A0A9Q1JS78_9CARY|nr:hypothetical protein Cgig2_014204 [Carnegiea gigantea]